MGIVLFDNSLRKNFFPLAFTNAMAALRCGIFTPAERWQLLYGEEIHIHTEDYLQPLYGLHNNGLNLWVDASLVLNDELIAMIFSLSNGQALYDNLGLIAGATHETLTAFDHLQVKKTFTFLKELQQVKRLQSVWQFIHLNEELIRYDYRLITGKQKPYQLSSTNNLIHNDDIFVDENVQAEYCIINASAGPVYIGKHVHIMEGSIIKGPAAICNYATVKAGAKLYPGSVIGPHCVAGGEIKNTILQSHSNKGHDGYVGDSVIGSWCNMGAGSTNSNVKNNGSVVQVWNYTEKSYRPFASKAGFVMGDHSKTAINTSINTGTTIGACCNVFNDGKLTPKLIDNFSWGVDGLKYDFEKAIVDIANWKKMKAGKLTSSEISVLKHIFDHY